MIKCPCCGGYKLQIYLESGGQSHYVCTECRKGVSIPKEKDASTMKVEYKGFSGELSELKAISIGTNGDSVYKISIYDRENGVTYLFENVELKNLKFLGKAVSFGG